MRTTIPKNIEIIGISEVYPVASPDGFG